MELVFLKTKITRNIFFHILEKISAMYNPTHFRRWKTIAVFLLNLVMLNHHTGSALHAMEHDEISDFSLNGYGTLAYTVDDRSNIAPARDISQKPDDGFNTGPTWKMDSRLGLHAHYRCSSELDVVLQGVIRDQVEFTVCNAVELAYAKFKSPFNLDVRAGRLGYDAFLMSDTRNVGYAYPWVRPPTEFYSWIPVFSVDGLDAAYRIDSGNVQWCIKAQAGSSRTDIPVGNDIYDIEADHLWALTLSRQSGPLQIKAGYSKFKLKNETDAFTPLHDGLNAVAGGTAALFPGISQEAAFMVKNLSFKDQKITYMTLGIYYDDGTWIAQAEISHTSMTADIMPHGNMGYVALGRRMGDWTPFFMFSMTHPTHDVYRTTDDWNIINQKTLHDQAVYLLNSTRMEQRTCSAGIRWDFHDRAAIKLQWDNSHVKPYYGLWWHDLEVASRAGDINLFTFSLEFMF